MKRKPNNGAGPEPREAAGAADPGGAGERNAGGTSGQSGAVDKPYPIFKLHDKIEEKTGWDGYADTDRR